MLIALIPARSGSKRIPNKNIRELAGHPLMAYTIQVAKDSGLFGEHIYVSSDSDEYLEIAERYGARGIKRPDYASDDESADYSWIVHAYNETKAFPPALAILRPTSPFRVSESLREAWFEMLVNRECTGIKAISPVREHPQKMWIRGQYLTPFDSANKYTWCRPTNTLRPVFVQNASLDMLWSSNLNSNAALVKDYMGDKILPLVTEGYEGFDINTEDDWILAEALIERGLATLPEIK